MKAIATISCDPTDPYASLITKFVSQSFPNKFTTNKTQLLEVLTDAIMASKQIRFGPLPAPESQVAIRSVIRKSIDSSTPIRIVSPWGSEKPNGSGIDVAELAALRTFACLNERVTAHYAPGIDVRLRVEDVSAPHLFFDRMEQARKEAKLYTDGLTRLNHILDLKYITVAADSLLVTEDVMNREADDVLPIFERHLNNPGGAKTLRELEELGWKGGAVNPEMVAFYMASYDKLYPELNAAEKMHRLARYLASSLARRKLGLSGALPEWGQDYIEVYFGTTPPGGRLPQHSRRVHYRTLPSFITSAHMAPWRAKGYLR